MTSLEKIKTGLDKASENYAENIVIRAGVAAIPIIGGSLDVIFSSKGNELIQQRIMSLMDFLEIEMEAIAESKVDKTFLETEEWFDLVYKSFDEVRKTRLKDKHMLFAKILAKSTIEHQDVSKIELYQNILSSISFDDFKVALYILSNRDKSENKTWDIQKKFWEELTIEGIEPDNMKFSLSRLFSLGLLNERYGTILDYTGGHYVVTKLLEEFVEFVGLENK